MVVKTTTFKKHLTVYIKHNKQHPEIMDLTVALIIANVKACLLLAFTF